MTIRAISDQNVAGKRLVVRADLNVPMQDGRVSDLTRITRFAAGMKPMLAQGASLVILSHFGRPRGVDMSQSLRLTRDDLSRALGCPVGFAALADAATKAADLRAGQVLLVENVRFEAGETEDDPALAARFAALGDVFVNDAFSAVHRAHASTTGIARLLPAFAGPLMMQEVGALTRALDAPQRPSVAIVGGAKVSSKIAVLEHLVAKVDHVIIGGGMANTFLLADGQSMGKSLHEPGELATVAAVRAAARAAGCRLHLPVDLVTATAFAAHAPHRVCALTDCGPDEMILDAGPASVAAFQDVLAGARTILWNGPLGAFEMPPFDAATVALARTAADLTRAGLCVTVAGGGDTVSALNAAGVTEQFSYVSTAGGAFLEWLEGRELPAIAALNAAAPTLEKV